MKAAREYVKGLWLEGWMEEEIIEAMKEYATIQIRLHLERAAGQFINTKPFGEQIAKDITSLPIILE